MFLIVSRLLVSGGFLLVITFLVPGRIYCRFISIVVSFSWNSSSHFQLFCVVYFIYSFYTSRLCTQPKLFLALNIFFFPFLFLSFHLSFYFLELKSLLSALCFDKLDFFVHMPLSICVVIDGSRGARDAPPQSNCFIFM